MGHFHNTSAENSTDNDFIPTMTVRAQAMSIEINDLLVQIELTDLEHSPGRFDDEADLALSIRRSELCHRLELAFMALQQELKPQLPLVIDGVARHNISARLRDIMDQKIAFQHARGLEPSEELLISRANYAQQAGSSPTTSPVLDLASYFEQVDSEVEQSACVVCEGNDHIVGHECGHLYYRGYIRELVMVAQGDEAYWPPRCCQRQFHDDTIEECLEREEFQSFQRKKLEFDTPAARRVYCSNTTCVRFVPLENIKNDIARCVDPDCRRTTCTICHAKSHTGDCPRDDALRETLAIAARQGWMRCANCRAMVEINLGCNHITCRCRHEFCYLCGRTWKECPCPRFTEHHLRRTAENVVERQAQQEREALVPAVRLQRVQQVQRELDERHECEHSETFQQMQNLRPGTTCDLCGKRFNVRYLRCRWCHLEVCYGCRRNRL